MEDLVYSWTLHAKMRLLPEIIRDNLPRKFINSLGRLQPTKINMITPTNTMESERYFKTLNRIISLLRNTTNKYWLNALVSVNRDLMHSISDFYERGLGYFISQKGRTPDIATKN